MSEENMAKQADGLGRTLLHLACQDNNLEPVRRLIEQGADINAADGGGITPLLMSIRHNTLEVAKELIRLGAALDYAVPDNKATYLHWALSCKATDIAKLLIEAGAPIDEKDRDGWTPLWFTVRKGPSDVMEMLLKRGANVNWPNPTGETPLDVAIYYKNDLLERFLRGFGAKTSDELKA